MKLLTVVLLLIPWKSSAHTVQFTDQEMCNLATWVLVGKTVTTTAAMQQDGFVVTTAQIFVEGIAHGTPPPIITVKTRGGTFNGEQYVVGGAPILDPNSRHLFFLAHKPGHLPMIIAGMDGAIRLDPEGDIPNNEDLEDLWEGYCGSN